MEVKSRDLESIRSGLKCSPAFASLVTSNKLIKLPKLCFPHWVLGFMFSTCPTLFLWLCYCCCCFWNFYHLILIYLPLKFHQPRVLFHHLSEGKFYKSPKTQLIYHLYQYILSVYSNEKLILFPQKHCNSYRTDRHLYWILTGLLRYLLISFHAFLTYIVSSLKAGAVAISTYLIQFLTQSR